MIPVARKSILLLMLLCLVFILVPANKNVSAASDINIYVTPEGNDSSSGTDFGSPVKTLEKARDLARELNTGQGNVIINLRVGLYKLDRPLVLSSADSGKNGFSIIWQGYNFGQTEAEKPVISGGRTLGGWSLYDGSKKIWRAPMIRDANGSLFDTRQLYYNGQRAIRARSADGLGITTYPIDACERCALKNPPQLDTPVQYYVDNSGNMQNWQNKSEIELGSEQEWKEFRCPVENISGTTITMQNPCWNNAQKHKVRRMLAPTWVENAFELLDQPGEWYLNKSDGYVYFIPPTGTADPDSLDVVVPILEKLIAADDLANVQFRGLTFAYATWLRPNTAEGYADAQANVSLTGDNSNLDGDLWPSDSSAFGAWTKTPGNLNLRRSQNIVFEKNYFIHLGGVGFNAESGSKNNTLIGNHFTDISGNAIQMGDLDKPNTSLLSEITEGNVIKNNYIHNIAAEYHDGVGIFNGYVRNTTITNNELFDLPYSGISVGWGWGKSFSYMQNNQVTNNLIYDHVKTLRDGGGIYTLSPQPGSRISGNYIHGQRNEFGAIYLDECTEGYTVSNNATFGNLRTLLINRAGDNTISENYWENLGIINYPYDPNTTATAHPKCNPEPTNYSSSIVNNTSVTSVSQIPDTIINQAGIETAYQDIKQPPCLVLDMPTNASPSGQISSANNSIRLQWDRTPGAASYLIRAAYIDPTTGIVSDACKDPGNVCLSINNNYYDLPIEVGKRYHWWVHAVNQCGAYGWPSSQTISVVTTAGDVNDDGQVNALDLQSLLSKWLTIFANGDMNVDGKINSFDFAFLIKNLP